MAAKSVPAMHSAQIRKGSCAPAQRAHLCRRDSPCRGGGRRGLGQGPQRLAQPGLRGAAEESGGGVKPVRAVAFAEPAFMRSCNCLPVR